MASAAIHTPAVCEAREGRQNHRPDGEIVADGPDDEYSTCGDCEQDIVRHYEVADESGGRSGWTRWSLAPVPVVV